MPLVAADCTARGAYFSGQCLLCESSALADLRKTLADFPLRLLTVVGGRELRILRLSLSNLAIQVIRFLCFHKFSFGFRGIIKNLQFTMLRKRNSSVIIR